MDNLFKAASKSKRKEMYKVKNGEHNDTWSTCLRQSSYQTKNEQKVKYEYYEKIKDFILRN